VIRGRGHEAIWLGPLVLAAALVCGGVAATRPVYALAAILAVGLGLLIFLQPRWLLLVLVAALPWEDMLYYPNKTLTVVKLLGLMLFVAWGLRMLMRRERVIVAPTYAPISVFIIVLGISYVVSTDPADGTLKVARYVLFIMLSFLVIQLVTDRTWLVRVVRVLALSVAAAGAYGLYRYLFVGGVSRVEGPIRDPNDFAYLLGATLPLVAVLFANFPRQRLLWGLCFALITGAALATLSRGALVGAVAVVLWAIASRRIPLRVVVATGLAIVAVAYVGLSIFGSTLDVSIRDKGNIASKNVSSRQAYWGAALQMTAERPLTGVGPERFRDLAHDYIRDSPIVLDRPLVHNSYLEVLAESGIFALAAFVAYLLGVWNILIAAGRRAAARGDEIGVRLSTAMQASWIFAIVAATFLSEQLTTPFWLFGALATVMAEPSVLPRTAVLTRQVSRSLAGARS
jgi:putative inorganic carbon (HCO3(-)) transporter